MRGSVWKRRVHRHVYGHVYRHVYRHVYIHVYMDMCIDMCIDMCRDKLLRRRQAEAVQLLEVRVHQRDRQPNNGACCRAKH